MKRHGTLVIVDMQPEFDAAHNKSLLAKIIRKIRLAKMLGYGIVVVEYGRAEQYEKFTGGDTDYRITRELAGYGRKAFVVKHIDDGSPQVIEALNHYGFNRKNIYVCGVNTCACVYATVGGLARKLPFSSVYVQADACSCGCSCDVRFQVTNLRQRYDNVCLAPETRGQTDEYHQPRAEPIR